MILAVQNRTSACSLAGQRVPEHPLPAYGRHGTASIARRGAQNRARWQRWSPVTCAS